MYGNDIKKFIGILRRRSVYGWNYEGNLSSSLEYVNEAAIAIAFTGPKSFRDFRTRDKLVGGERSHHCAIPAPQTYILIDFI